jgi:hypothetical protein
MCASVCVLWSTLTLARAHHRSEDEVAAVATLMRRHGVRRANAEKNIGTAKYAFSWAQVGFLPAAYRPPTGTGGANAT